MRNLLPSQKRILLADDDSDDREMFAEALADINSAIELITKRDGEELMDYLHENPPSPEIIFLDLNMPRKNGKECLVELRANDKYRNIPIIIYTTSLNPVDIEEAYARGATFFLRKPNSFEELKDILNTTLRSGLSSSGERTKDNFVINASLRLV